MTLPAVFAPPPGRPFPPPAVAFGNRKKSLSPPRPGLEGTLLIGHGHRLYAEVYGNPRGTPAVELHGGPGGGISPGIARYYPLDTYRLVMFDQRGCGKSTPSVVTDPERALWHNTTADLVADMECLREDLGISRWVVSGGSWGGTLALAYASAHPERVLALVLHSLYLGRQEDTDWFVDEHGAGSRRANDWFQFQAALRRLRKDFPSTHQAVLPEAHYLVHHPNPQASEPAALAWRRWEWACSGRDEQTTLFTESIRRCLEMARLETHYMVNGCFLEKPLLDTIAALGRQVPVRILHGLHDLLCPPEQAIDLNRRLDALGFADVRLTVVPDAGHSLEGEYPDRFERTLAALPQVLNGKGRLNRTA